MVERALLQIAIDGPASSGKSSVGRLVAEALGCSMLDTGLLYRAVAWSALREELAVVDEPPVLDLLDRITIQVTFQGKEALLLVNGVDVTGELHRPSVSELTARIAQFPEVRRRLVTHCRAAAERRDIIMVGRDIGSVVLPHAPLKIYLSATAEERARRRFEEYVARGVVVREEDVYQDLLKRDEADMTRAHSPLAAAADAHRIDTTTLGLSEVVGKVVALARARGGLSAP